MMRLRWILFLAGLLLVASAIAGVAQPRLGHTATTTPTTKTITVNGNGSITTVPDRATFQFSIETHAKTASAALTQNSADATAVIAALKAAGVSSANIQTSQVSLQPQTSQDGTTIIGYVASNSVTVKTPLAGAGAVIDAAVGAGANGVSGPSSRRVGSELALSRCTAQGGRRREAQGAGARRCRGPQPRRRPVDHRGRLVLHRSRSPTRCPPWERRSRRERRRSRRA